MAVAGHLSSFGLLRRGPIARYALGSAAFFAAIVLLLAFAASMDRVRRGEEMDFLSITRGYAFGFAPWFLLAPLIFARARRHALGRRTLRAVSLDVVALIALSAIAVLLYIFLINAPALGETGFHLLGRVRTLNWTFDVFIFALCYAGGRLDGERELKDMAAAERHALETRLLRVEKEAASLELHELRNRFSSHFVLNALSNILGLIRTADPQSAADAVLALGDILKRVSGSGGPLSTVGAELDFLRAYLTFQRIRYPTASFAIKAPDEVLNFVIPTFLLQPLVENCFKHGLTPEGVLDAELTIALDDDKLRITTVNSTPRPLHNAGPDGEGRRLTRARLELAYGAAFSMQQFAQANRYVVDICLSRALP